MAKMTKFLAGMAVGAGGQYLLDPVSGRSRRARLSDQARSRMRSAAGDARQRVEYERGRMRGMIHEMGPDRREAGDDDTVLQRIRSEVLGPAGVTSDVTVDVDKGVVTVSGSLPKEKADRIMDEIVSVAGVESARRGP